MAVDFVRPEITEKLKAWNLIEDCIKGQEAVKRGKTKYLPQPNAEDKSVENAARYAEYLERAVYYNATGRTLKGLVGQIFAKDVVADLPTELEALKANISGSGLSLEQQAKKAAGNVIGFGRSALFVDYPQSEQPLTKQQIDELYIMPTINLYGPKDVINWDTSAIGARVFLSLVVISENYSTPKDEFQSEVKQQFRVLRIIDGKYQVEIWRKDEAGAHKPIAPAVIPTDASGKPFTEIPFTFIGSENNDPDVDEPLLYDMAVLNIAHYRNSADYEDSCSITGQPTPYAAGLTQSWVDDVLKGTVCLGSRAIIPLPQGATAGLLQASPNTMPFEAMAHKERQVVALGAKLVEQKTVQRTATEVTSEEASEHSALSTVSKNLSSAYTQAFKWAAQFAGANPDKVSVEFNSDFETSRMTPQERQQLIAEWQGGAITFEEMRYNLRRSGVAYIDDEEAKSAIESEGNMGGSGALNGQ